MGPLPLHLAAGIVWPWLAMLLLLLVFLNRFHQQRADRAEKNAELRRLSDLHLFGRALAESSDPARMASLTVRRVSEMLQPSCSCVFIQTGEPNSASCAQAQGFAAATMGKLSSDRLRSYLSSRGDRWGNLLVFPDLSQPSLGIAWQRDEPFQELRTVLELEGLETLAAVGLRMRHNSYGVLLIGRRKAGSFRPPELRLALAIGNQLSVALENWSLHKAAERRNKELRILHRVSESLRGAFDLQSQMEILRRELKGVFNAADFSREDVLTLQTLADQMAMALHNARAYQVAIEQSITDGLTGLKTHRYFMEALEAEWRRSTRAGRRFSIIMMDLDSFKQVNDHEGHLEGDKVLVAVARLLDARSRQSNVTARYGGDEFAILLPETSTGQAEILAERLRAAVESDPFLRAHAATASLGLATFPDHGATQEEILRVADSGMYLAKHQGGNCVKTAALMSKGADAECDQQVLEAYLGVAVKRMFSTGPDAFNQYLRRFEQMMQGDGGKSPSLLDTVTALAFAIEAKDPYTQGHSQAVSRLGAQIAMQVRLPEAQVEEIRLAGMLHDIGKIGVPESVLNKPALLTAEEYEVIKSHAALGARILEPLKVKAIAGIRDIVLHHHEAFGGQGYPHNLNGEQIPIGARIVTVADAFDTMISERAYKRGCTVEDALAELRHCQGTQFDPFVVDAFIQSLAALNGHKPDSIENLMRG